MTIATEREDEAKVLHAYGIRVQVLVRYDQSFGPQWFDLVELTGSSMWLRHPGPWLSGNFNTPQSNALAWRAVL